MLSIRNRTTRTVPVTGLDKNSEYEFQVLAFTSVGDGPKSSVEVERTKEDGKSSTMTVTYHIYLIHTSIRCLVSVFSRLLVGLIVWQAVFNICNLEEHVYQVKVNVFLAVPSTAPSNLTVIVNNSTTVTASWRLPPEIARNGIIRGFRLLFKKKDSGGLPAILNISNGTIHSQVVTGLDKYSEYEF